MGRTKGSKNGFRKVPNNKHRTLTTERVHRIFNDVPVQAIQSGTPLPFFEPNILELYRQKEYEKCIHLIEEVLATEDNEDKNHYKILQAGAYTMLKEDFGKAHLLLDEVLAENPSNSHAMFNKGVAFYFEKKKTESVYFLNKALELNPNGMEKANEMKQRIDLESRKAVILVQKINLETEESKNFLDNINGSIDRQLDDLNLFSDGELDMADISVGQFEFNGDDTDMIEPMEEKKDISIKSLSPKPQLDCKAMSAGNFEQNKTSDEASSKSPIMTKNDNIQSITLRSSLMSPKAMTAAELLGKGHEFFSSGSLKKALKMFSKAKRIEPNMSQAEEMEEKIQELLDLKEVAATNMEQKNYWAVVEILNEALEVDGVNDFIKGPFYYQRGLALFHLGKNEESLSDYAEYVRIDKKLASE